MASFETACFGDARGAVRRFTLHSAAGVEVEILDHGATLAALRAPDRRGRLGPIVLGFAHPLRWLEPHPHLGGVVGRCANRIAGGHLRLGGVERALVLNEGRHHLHGGAVGFDRCSWSAQPFAAADACGVRLKLERPDGDQGYPGRLRAEAVYTLRDDGVLRLDLAATSDRATAVNLASHAYWNLRDGGASPVLDHELELAASRYTPVDAAGIPTGEIAPVAGTAFDFRTPHRLGERIAELLERRGGYDHNYVLDAGGARGGAPAFAARLHDPVSGRVLRLETTQPGLQLYTGNRLDACLPLRGGAPCGRFHGVCLEAQRFPDAPNQPGFPSVALAPGARYAESVVLAPSVEAA